MDRGEAFNELYGKLAGTRNMLGGMLFNPSIPQSAKSAMTSKIEEIEQVLDRTEELLDE